jgi:UrcA family protein
MQKFFASLATIATLTMAAVPALGLLQAAHAAEATATITVGDLSDPAQAAQFKARIDAQGQALCRQVVDRHVRGALRQDECLRNVRLEVSRQLTSAQRIDLDRAAKPVSVQVAAR